MKKNNGEKLLSVAECKKVIAEIAENKGYTQEDLNKFAKCFLDKNGQPSYYSRLNREDLNDFIELIQFDNERTVKKEPIPPLTDFTGDKTPNKADFENYYQHLLDLGYKKATITTVVTRLRKVYPDAPPYQEQQDVHAQTAKNNNVRRKVNNKVLMSDMLATLEQLAKSGVIEHTYLYLALATGRRESEILDKDSFDLKKLKGDKVLFKGQKKLKGRELKPYWIPVIGDMGTFKTKLKELYNYMDNNPDLFKYTTDATAHRLFNSHIHRKFKNTVSKMLCRDMVNLLKPHNLRALYAQYCNIVLNQGKVNDLTYFTTILGHDKNDTNTQNHYKLVQLVDDRGKEVIKAKEAPQLLKYGFNPIQYATCLQKIKSDEIYTTFVEALRVWYNNPKEFFTLPPELSAQYKKLSSTRRNFIKAIFTLPDIKQ